MFQPDWNQFNQFATSPVFLIVGSGAFLYTIYYLTQAVKKPKLICPSQGHFGNFLASSLPAAGELYWPPAWCYHSHLLTSLSNVFRHLQPRLQFYRELIPTPDGGQFSLDWYDPIGALESQGLNLSRPVAIFLPGLTGHSHAEYLRHLISTAAEVGYQPVVLNCRGLGGTALLSPRLYCAANHDDLQTALEHIRSKNSSLRIVATGLSLGGSILASYLTTHGANCLIDAACLISVCWDFHKGTIQLKTGFLNPRVNRLLTGLLQKVVNQHRHIYADLYDLEAVNAARGLRAFDEAFTRRMFGYESTDAYYSAATASGKIAKIRIPTLAINAGDDMLAPEADLPLEEIEAESTHLAMLVTARGGHIGFMEGGFLPRQRPTYYLERVFGQYLEALYKLNDSPRKVFD